MKRKDIYKNMDEFERIVMITNFIRNLSSSINVESIEGKEIAKKRWNEYLDEEVNE